MDKTATPHVSSRGELPLSGDSLGELMRAVLDKGKPCRFEAKGTSMHPFVRDGDVVTVVPLVGSGPKPGDIAAFIHPVSGGVRVHRVVKVAGGRFVMKGDNALGDDGALGLEAILGLVARVERGGLDVAAGRPFGAAVLARLSRTSWFTRLARRTRRLFGRGEGKG